jgi:Fe-S cluster assembly protein SufB
VGGGSFIYVPPGVHVDMPLQAYFRINAENAGQFERTLIIADGVRRCTTSRGSAPVYHRLVALRCGRADRGRARIRHTTIQNWSPNVYNLVTVAVAQTEATVSGSTGTSARSSR